MSYVAAIIYACSAGWCVHVLGTVEGAATADACIARLYKEVILTSGYPTCFIPMNNNEAHALPQFLSAPKADVERER